MSSIKAKVVNNRTIKARTGTQNAVKVLSQQTSAASKLIDLNDVNAQLKTRDGMILVWDLSTQTFVMTDTIDSSTLVLSGIVTFTNETNSSSTSTGALVVNGGIGVSESVNIGGNISIVGITSLSSSGGITTPGGDLYVGGNLYINDNVSIVGFVSVTEGLYYDSGDYNGPNGVAYFDNDGKLVGASSTETSIETSNYILTTLETAGIGTPAWTSTIDGGSY